MSLVKFTVTKEQGELFERIYATLQRNPETAGGTKAELHRRLWAGSLASLARELGVLRQRTRKTKPAIENAKPRRPGGPGVSDAARRLILRLHRQGKTTREIVDELTSRKIPTARGGNWAPSTVHRVLKALRNK